MSVHTYFEALENMYLNIDFLMAFAILGTKTSRWPKSEVIIQLWRFEWSKYINCPRTFWVHIFAPKTE